MKAYRFLLIVITIISFALNACMVVHGSKDCSASLQEALIGIQCKIIEHGTIGILSNSDSKVKLTCFSYRVDLARNVVSCRKIDEIEIDCKSELANSFVWYTDEMFRKREKGSWREPYFKCFANDFLDMPNEKKLEMLDSLSYDNK